MAIKRNELCDFRLGEYHPKVRDHHKPRLWHKDNAGIAARTLRCGNQFIVCSTPELAQDLERKLQESK